MDPASYEAVLYGRVDTQITPKHSTMDQHTNVFDAQLNPNQTTMDFDLYKTVRDGNLQYLGEQTDLFDIELTPNRNTILHVAVHFGKSDCVAMILEKKPCLIRRVNSNNETPLHIATREQHYNIVQALIDCAKELDQEPESGGGTRLELLRATNVDGNTALHLAVQEGDAKIVSLLAGEDPDFQHPANKAKETPLYLAAERKDGYSMVDSILAYCRSPGYTGPSDRSPLHAATISGNSGPGPLSVGIKKLLDRYKELIDKADMEGWTPLHYASYCGNFVAAVELLKMNKSVGYTRTSEKHDKSTALHIAAAANNPWMMEVILYYCPDCWEMVDSKGRNILHVAVDWEAELVIRSIIKEDWLESLMNQKDFDGNTPLHLLASSDIEYNMDDLINHRRANMYASNNHNLTPGDVAPMHRGAMYTDHSSWPKIGKGGRNIAKENWKEIYEKERKRRDKINAVVHEARGKTSANHMLVATLIATITFAAAFTLPGGYDGNQGPKQGMAVLVREASFKVFVLANTIAVMCSTSSVAFYISAAFYLNEDDQQNRYKHGFRLLVIAMVTMMIGFISGTYAVLVHSPGLAIATSIVASFSLLIYVHELIRLAYRWVFL